MERPPGDGTGAVLRIRQRAAIIHLEIRRTVRIIRTQGNRVVDSMIRRRLRLIIHRSIDPVRVPRRRHSDIRVFRVILAVYRVVKGVRKSLRRIRLLHRIRTVVYLRRRRHTTRIMERPPGDFSLALQAEGSQFIVSVRARPFQDIINAQRIIRAAVLPGVLDLGAGSVRILTINGAFHVKADTVYRIAAHQIARLDPDITLRIRDRRRAVVYFVNPRVVIELRVDRLRINHAPARQRRLIAFLLMFRRRLHGVIARLAAGQLEVLIVDLFRRHSAVILTGDILIRIRSRRVGKLDIVVIAGNHARLSLVVPPFQLHIVQRCMPKPRSSIVGFVIRILVAPPGLEVHIHHALTDLSGNVKCL